MRGFYYQVTKLSLLRTQYQISLCSCIGAPEDEDHRLRPGCEQFNDTVGELLPAAGSVRARLVRPHCQNRIQKQDSLPCPRDQYPV